MVVEAIMADMGTKAEAGVTKNLEVIQRKGDAILKTRMEITNGATFVKVLITMRTTAQTNMIQSMKSI